MAVSGRILALAEADAKTMGWPVAVLTWAGYRVDRAETTDAALRMLGAAPYDLLLLSYSSSAEDREQASKMLQDPELRLPTLILLADHEDFITPPQTRYVPTAFLEPGFSQAEMLRLVEKLREFRM